MKKKTFVLLLLSILLLIMSRNLIFSFIQGINSGNFNYKELPYLEKEKVHMLPMFFLGFLRLPSSVAVNLMNLVFYLIGISFMFLLIKEVLQRLFGKVNLFVLFVATLIYASWPWNIIGDNFLSIVMMRFLTPVVLYLSFRGLKKNDVKYIFLSAAILSFITYADPRSVLFITPLIVVLFVIPNFFVWHFKHIFKNGFIFCVSFLILSSFEIIYRFSVLFSAELYKNAISIVGISPFSSSSFLVNFRYSNLFNILNGSSFFETGRIYSLIPNNLLAKISVAVTIILFLMLFSYVLLLFLNKPRINKKIVKLLLILFVCSAICILIFFTSNESNLPFVISFLLRNVSNPVIQKLVLAFRTNRFLNLFLSISLSLFIGVLLQHSDRLTIGRKKLKFIMLTATLILISLCFLRMYPVIKNGLGVANYGGINSEVSERSLEYSKMMKELSKIDSGFEGKVIAVFQLAGGLPNFYMMHGIEAANKQYLVRYTVDSSYGDFFKKGNIDHLNTFLFELGVNYIIVDNWKINDTSKYNSILTQLNSSSDFKKIFELQNMTCYKVIGKSELKDLLIVYGGLNTFKNSKGLIEEFYSESYNPIYADSDVNLSMFSDISSKVLVDWYTSEYDLIAPFMIHSNKTILIHDRDFNFEINNPMNYWVRSCITDNIGCTLYSLMSKTKDYQWQFPFSSRNAIVYTHGGQKTILTSFDIPTNGTYSVLIRKLVDMNGGKARISVDGYNSITSSFRSRNNETFFTVQKLFDLNLSKGLHHLSVENIEGLTGFDTIFIVPPEEIDLITLDYIKFASNKIYVQRINKDQINSQTLEGCNIVKYDPKTKLVETLKDTNVSTNSRYIEPYALEENQKEGLFSYQIYNDSEEDVELCISLNSDIANHNWSWYRLQLPTLKPGEYNLLISYKSTNMVSQHLLVEEKLKESMERISVIHLNNKKDYVSLVKPINITSNQKDLYLTINAGKQQTNNSDVPTKLCIGTIKIYDPSENFEFYCLPTEKENVVDLNRGKIDLNITEKKYNNVPYEYHFDLPVSGNYTISIPEIYDNLWRIKCEKEILSISFPTEYVITAFYISNDHEANSCVAYNPKMKLLISLDRIYFKIFFRIILIFSAVLFSLRVFFKIKNHAKKQLH